MERKESEAPGAPVRVGDVTLMLMALRNRDPNALQGLLPLVYAELHRRAKRLMGRERRDHTLQPTALVHEAFLKLFDKQQTSWQDRAHFFAVAAHAMREILVDHARGRAAAKRGGDAGRVSIDDVSVATEPRSVDLLALDEALDRLAAQDERQSHIVELRFFGGLTIEETAEVLGCSIATVNREWRHARAWLYRRLAEPTP